MKKIWGKYSYTIILIATSFLLITVIAIESNSNNEEYIAVTVNQGDSLWKIAEELSDEHNLTKQEFVSWVEKENGIINGTIYAGEEIIVPIVSKVNEMPTQTASLDIE